MQLSASIGEHAIRLSPTSPNGRVVRNRIACRTASTSRISPSIRNRRHRVQAKNRWPTAAGPSGSTRSTVSPRTRRTRPGASATPRRPRPGPAPGQPDTRSRPCLFPPLQPSPLTFRKPAVGLTLELTRRRRGCLSEKPGPTPAVGLNELLDHGLYILHALLQALLQVGLSVYIFFHDRARRGFLKECIEQRCTSLHFPKSRVVQFVLG